MNLRHRLELSLLRERLRLLFIDIRQCEREIDEILHKATGADSNGLGHSEGPFDHDGIRNRFDGDRMVRDGGPRRDVK